MKIIHSTYIAGEYWTDLEIDILSNGCGSSRGIYRPPLARRNKGPCDRHDVRCTLGGSIFDKFIADLILFIDILIDNFRHIWFFGLGNIYGIFMAFMYFIGVGVFGTIIDITALLIFGKKSAFQFGPKKKKKDILNINKYKHENLS